MSRLFRRITSRPHTILGIDPGIANLGVCLAKVDYSKPHPKFAFLPAFEVVFAATIPLVEEGQKAKEQTAEEATRVFNKLLALSLKQLEKADIAVIETQSFSNNKKMLSLASALFGRLLGTGIPVVMYVPSGNKFRLFQECKNAEGAPLLIPQTVQKKRYITNKKNSVLIAEACGVLKQKEKGKKKRDTADAFGVTLPVMAYVLEKFGVEIVPV